MGLYLGRKTPGICDRCGRRVPHSELGPEIERGSSRGNMVCRECFDPDHPQNWVGTTPVSDKQSVDGNQPEPNARADRSLYGFNPVGAPGNYLITETGQVSIVIS